MTEPIKYWNAPRGTTLYACADGELVNREDYARLEQECERLRLKLYDFEHGDLFHAFAERDAALVQVEVLRQALTKIHDRCEAFVGDDSGMQVHSVEVLMDIAERGLGSPL